MISLSVPRALYAGSFCLVLPPASDRKIEALSAQCELLERRCKEPRPNERLAMVMASIMLLQIGIARPTRLGFVQETIQVQLIYRHAFFS